jgi:hypothetical protein
MKKLLPLSAAGMILCLVAAKLLIHLYAGRHYGYFRDELYYLACSRHLDWGYVDQPPLIALIAWMVRSVIGDSLAAIRLLPTVAGACEVALTALIAKELGGKLVAQGLAALATLVAGGILATQSFFSMNAFEPLFWMGCAWVVIRIVNTGNQKLWIWFGVLAGFGLENKHSMLIFGAGSHQRASELLSVGTARLHGRERHRDAWTAGGARGAIRRGSESRERVSSLLDAFRAFRRVLLPGG